MQKIFKKEKRNEKKQNFIGVTVKGKPLKDHLEVKGQEYAINFLNNIIKENEVLSLRLIKEFHILILGAVDPEIAGQFKKFKNKIVGSTFETSDPIFVEEDLEKILKDYFSSTENAIERQLNFMLILKKYILFLMEMEEQVDW